MRLDALLAATRRRLQEAGVGTPALDARLLVGAALRLDAAGLIAAATEDIPARDRSAAWALIKRRLAGEPVARILGRREFYGRAFRLSPDTLDPRPETEHLVAAALDLLAGMPDPLVVDVGTGGGAVLVSLLAERADARGLGTDLSVGALRTAAENARCHGVGDRALFVCGHFLEPVSGPVDLVVSNPPYIATTELDGLAPEVRDFDPPLALDGGPDGLAAYRAILDDAARVLAPGGGLVLEIGHDQGVAVSGLAAAHGFAAELRRDLAGLDRVVLLRRAADFASWKSGAESLG